MSDNSTPNKVKVDLGDDIITVKVNFRRSTWELVEEYSKRMGINRTNALNLLVHNGSVIIDAVDSGRIILSARSASLCRRGVTLDDIIKHSGFVQL